jgi:hypothetical protein
MLLFAIVAGSLLQVYEDYPTYWSRSPVPFHIFLLTQVGLLSILAFLMGQQKLLKHPAFAVFTFTVIVGLIWSTVQGLRWFLDISAKGEISQDESEQSNNTTVNGGSNTNGTTINNTSLPTVIVFELKTSYYIEAVVLLSIPIAVATFFLIILVIFVCIVFFEYRRNRLRNRGAPFEDDQEAYAEEVAETYMRLLEPVTFDRHSLDTKHMDCSICLREFEQGEALQRIPNCSHMFHEACLKKWFVQA